MPIAKCIESKKVPFLDVELLKKFCITIGTLYYITDTHTDSGDMSPTRTCVPYVLLAIV